VALFRRKTAEPIDDESEPVTTEVGGRRKSGPTPTRKQAEAARRQRMTQQLSKKELARRQRAERMRAVQARDNAADKQLLRDYIDSRRNIGEFLLPGMVVILAASFLYSVVPDVSLVATVLMYVFLAVVIIDTYLMWRGYKKLLNERLPGTPTRGLLMYGMNRSIQIRRFRMPQPRVKRGEPV
jgi:hypothetical protein